MAEEEGEEFFLQRLIALREGAERSPGEEEDLLARAPGIAESLLQRSDDPKGVVRDLREAGISLRDDFLISLAEVIEEQMAGACAAKPFTILLDGPDVPTVANALRDSVIPDNVKREVRVFATSDNTRKILLSPFDSKVSLIWEVDDVGNLYDPTEDTMEIDAGGKIAGTVVAYDEDGKVSRVHAGAKQVIYTDDSKDPPFKDALMTTAGFGSDGIYLARSGPYLMPTAEKASTSQALTTGDDWRPNFATIEVARRDEYGENFAGIWPRLFVVLVRLHGDLSSIGAEEFGVLSIHLNTEASEERFWYQYRRLSISVADLTGELITEGIEGWRGFEILTFPAETRLVFVAETVKGYKLITVGRSLYDLIPISEMDDLRSLALGDLAPEDRLEKISKDRVRLGKRIFRIGEDGHIFELTDKPLEKANPTSNVIFFNERFYWIENRYLHERNKEGTARRTLPVGGEELHLFEWLGELHYATTDERRRLRLVRICTPLEPAGLERRAARITKPPKQGLV